MKQYTYSNIKKFLANAVVMLISFSSYSYVYSQERIDTLPTLEVYTTTVDKSINSAVPVHSLNQDKILRTGVTDIADALKRLPGINIRDYGGAGGLKTVSVRGLGAVHTGVAYDGIPLSDLRSGEIDLSRYSLENISSISLTAGDYEEIFTSARMASTPSVIAISSIPQIFTRKISLSSKLKIGAFGLINPFIDFSLSNCKNLSGGIIANFIHAKNDYPYTLYNGDFKTREYRSNSLMNSGNLELNFVWKPYNNSQFDFKTYYYLNHRQLPGPVVLYTQESNERLEDDNIFLQSKYRTRLSSVFSILGMIKFNRSSSRYTDINGRYPGGKLDEYYLQFEGYASSALLWIPLHNLFVDYSADWWINTLSSNSSVYRKPIRNNILQSITARWIFHQFNVTGRLLYSIFEDKAMEMDKKTFQRLSPALSLSYKPFQDYQFFLRTSYKNIFRMPTFNELYFSNYGSISLNPEITDQFNIGTTIELPSYGFLTSLSFTADGYFNRIRDKIVAIPFNLFKWTMSNLGKVHVYGLDLTLNSDFNLGRTQSLMLSVNYTYQRAISLSMEGRSDWHKQLPYTPLNSGAASLSWLNPWVSVATHLTGVSARYATTANLASTRIPGYFDAGVALFHIFNLKNHALEIRADIINIFNKQYQIVAKYPMPGRHWQTSIKFNF